MKILIIDDDEIDRRLSARALKAWSESIELIESTSVASAMNVLKAGPVDAILLDFQLPDGTALDCLELIRSNPDHAIAVVVLSGREDMETAEKCLQAGAQDFILKGDFSPRHLARALVLARQRYSMEQEIVRQKEQLRELAEHDVLSGLYNRRFFNMSLDAALQRSERNGNQIGLIMLDLDRFKEINDTHGHEAGDLLIKEVAYRLGRITRKGDILCRLGGDEFAILIHDVAASDDIQALPRRIMDIMTPPVELSRVRLPVRASVGLAISVPGVTTGAQLLKEADTAMYHAKQAGRNRVHIFSENTASMARQQSQLERDLMDAWSRREFELYYQPMVDSRGNHVYGAEVFLRWNHRERGLLKPKDFLQVLEENGLIVALGQWIIAEACKQAAGWLHIVKKNPPGNAGNGEGVPQSFVVSINIAAAQIASGHLQNHVAQALQSSGLPPESLELEMNERVLNADMRQSLTVLTDLVAQGVKISLDDFASSSSSSFVSLRDLPISVVKFDISLQERAHNLDRGKLFVESLLALARNQGFLTMVKHVETEEQLIRLSTLKVDRWQGFRFSEPVSAANFSKLLTQSK